MHWVLGYRDSIQIGVEPEEAAMWNSIRVRADSGHPNSASRLQLGVDMICDTEYAERLRQRVFSMGRVRF